MYPIPFFRFFPLFIIAPPAMMPEYSNQPHLRGQASVYAATYRGGLQGYRNRQERVNSPYTDPYLVRVSMTYPTRSFGLSTIVREGDRCFTTDGRFGLCRQKFRCSFYTEYTSIYAEKITSCGQRGQSALICCPEGQNQSIQLNAKPTPTYSAVKIPDTTSTKQSLSVKPYQPNENVNLANPTSSVDAGAPALSSVPVQFDPTPAIVNGFDFTSDEAPKVCGVYDSKSKHQNGNSWPWIVSIGRTYNNDTIEWFCLGSLITTGYILTTAHCLQGSPTVVAIGQIYVGSMAAHEKTNTDLHKIGEFSQAEKFVYPAMYKNVGLIRLSKKTQVSANRLPVCFPFLGGVLDIIDFTGASVQTMGFRFPAKTNVNMISQVEIADYRVFNNSLCSLVVNNNPSDTITKKLPRGVKSEIMCATSKTQPPLCPIAGAPVTIFDTASDSYVVIGLSMGDPTCSEFDRKITLVTRINSYSNWIREHVDNLPVPPPCYI